MNHDSSNGQDQPFEESPAPNEDGCVLGTAGRNEDPNATTDWDHPDDTCAEDAQLRQGPRGPRGRVAAQWHAWDRHRACAAKAPRRLNASALERRFA